MSRTPSPRTRRSFVQGGLLASLAMVASLGALPIHDVVAEKNDGRYSKSDIKKLAKKAAADCISEAGGTPTISERRGGTTVSCTGGANGNYSCTYTSKGSNCFPTAKTIPDVPNQPLEPESPFADPSDGADQPLEPDSPISDPGDVPDQPLEPDGGGVVLT